MKSNRLRALRRVTAIALLFYTLLLVYVFYATAVSNPKWSQSMAERHIQSATTMQELQSHLRDAVLNLTWGLHSKNRIVLILFISTIGVVVFLGWSLFMTGRLKGED